MAHAVMRRMVFFILALVVVLAFAEPALAAPSGGGDVTVSQRFSCGLSGAVAGV